MSKINNMEKLRNFAIETLESLKDGTIDTNQAVVRGKICETVINTVKSQLEYGKMLQQETYIPFLHDCHTVTLELGSDSKKRLPHLKDED